MRRLVSRSALLAILSAAVFGCGKPCRTPNDCSLGEYCAVEVDGTSVRGFCHHDCETSADCTPDPDGLTIPICNNEGHCHPIVRRPTLRVSEPENDILLPEGTKRIRLLGEVETVSAGAVISATPVAAAPNCYGGATLTVKVDNPEKGHLAKLPFVIDNIDVYPGRSSLLVIADVGGASDSLKQLIEVPCAGCAEIQITKPLHALGVASDLVLDHFEGDIAPDTITTAIWRVKSQLGDVFDGALPVQRGHFAIDNLPLFAGFNRVEVVVSGVGAGENRCAAGITTAIPSEHGLRAILNWDGSTSDLDLHVIGPGGRFGDPMSTLSSQSKHGLGGALVDAFAGLGPEIATVATMADGVYGVIVEPVFDDMDPGENAFLRVLVDGRTLVRGVLGPEHLSSDDGMLWIVGTIAVVSGSAVWTSIGQLVPSTMPPTRPPADWPSFY